MTVPGYLYCYRTRFNCLQVILVFNSLFQWLIVFRSNINLYVHGYWVFTISDWKQEVTTVINNVQTQVKHIEGCGCFCGWVAFWLNGGPKDLTTFYWCVGVSWFPESGHLFVLPSCPHGANVYAFVCEKRMEIFKVATFWINKIVQAINLPLSTPNRYGTSLFNCQAHMKENYFPLILYLFMKHFEKKIFNPAR